MKVFISQPMNGRTDQEIKEERNEIIKGCQREYGPDVEIIDSFFEGAPHNAKPLWFMGKALQLMSDADLVLFAPDWSASRGCSMERNAADAYGIKIEFCKI